MNKIINTIILVIIPFISGFASVNKNTQKIFLCVDSNAVVNTKLVYGYINGKKTDCMPEQKLREMISKATFSPDSIILKQFKDSLLSTAVEKSSDTYADSITNLIRNYSSKSKKLELRQADLMNLRLDGLNMSDANLESADLRFTSMRGVNLSNADLRVAYMKKVDLRRANLTNAEVKGAYLQGADLRGVSGLTKEMIGDIGTLYKAKLDKKLMLIVKENFPNKLRKPGKCWNGNTWADDDACEDTNILHRIP